MGSAKIRWDGLSPVVDKNQTRVPQLAQQFRMLLGKELESSRLVGFNAGDIQNNRGEACNLRIVRLSHSFKAGHVPFGDVRLLKEPEDVVLVPNSEALALRPGLATLAHMDCVTFAGKLLVRTFAPANPAVMSHPGSPATENKIINQETPDRKGGP